MGKFKELSIALEEARELLREHSGKHQILDCNCDQALLLKDDLQKAINFGVAAEAEVESMQNLMSGLVHYIIYNGIMTVEALEEFGISMSMSTDPDESQKLH